MPTQRDRILNHLQSGKALTPIEALDLYGCLALSQRIGELKRQGFPIEAATVASGRKRYAQYRMRPYQPALELREAHGG